MRLMIADTGCANIASVRYGFARLGVDAEVSPDPARLCRADRLVLPGVGSAQAAMTALRQSGLDSMMRAFERPLLGICLGMQLLFEHSDEAGTPCLGLAPGRVRALPGSAGPVPHMGWNTLQEIRNHNLLRGVGEGDYVYFVHAFAAAPDAHTLARCTYGAPFAAVLAKDNVFGCQFHPERSAATGARILQNFLTVQP